ncbi:hypothetical protein OGAPHI_006576 [Ogataea philodendri]|uniref:Uncharacterized protein n=1 Tax=Ogataea philodendri TaxID=1378263 RepID=A0A9P8NY39_9ASCO|nr:uncharacterized protein OGAPHI_006576 [Ogataea philodendri]KAH3661169.1 hypothetical protein OGAPHI_006576 [Ogataea philodendri]
MKQLFVLVGQSFPYFGDSGDQEALQRGHDRSQRVEVPEVQTRDADLEPAFDRVSTLSHGELWLKNTLNHIVTQQVSEQHRPLDVWRKIQVQLLGREVLVQQLLHFDGAEHLGLDHGKLLGNLQSVEVEQRQVLVQDLPALLRGSPPRVQQRLGV